MQAQPPHLEIIGVSKRFGTVQALDGVSVEVRPGSFHALLGENGAGKSTLVKCILGLDPMDAGEIRIDGQAHATTSPQEARRDGIGMVFQHFTLIPSMTVAENLALARPDLPRLISWPKERRRLGAFLEHAPFSVSLHDPVERLAAGQKQKVEILKQLYLQTRLLILDEPTSVLTPQEADEVLKLLRDMVDSGRLSVLLITHKFREVTTFAEEVTVLRRGRVSGRGLVRDLSPARLAEMMMGESLAEQASAKTKRSAGEEMLQIRGLRVATDKGLDAVGGIDLSVRAGEIVGVAGISGNGQRELVEALAGQRPVKSGEIRVRGERYRATRSGIRRHGFFVIPEEPLQNAAMPAMSVAQNLALRIFDVPPYARGGFLNPTALRRNAEDVIARFKIKAPSADASIATLSGGNVQRTILARELTSGRIQVMVAANPCAGLDFRATAFIHHQLITLRNQGAAVLLVSEDLEELCSLADRIIVMSGGQLVYETAAADIDVNVIGSRMAGHTV